MPWVIRKIRNSSYYVVKNKDTGHEYAHHTTKANAQAQVRLLRAVEHGFKPTKKLKPLLSGGIFL